jgi:hypothetical protein
VTTTVESSGNVIGTWENVIQLSNPIKGQPAMITSIATPKDVNDQYGTYQVGFNIKMNLSKVNNTKQLAVLAAFSTPNPLQPFNQKLEGEESVVPGKISQLQIKTADVTKKAYLTTIIFTSLFDVTVPRNVSVPVARFILTEDGKQSLVNVKIKVNKQ